jgi:hypothetical protein
MGLIFVNRVDRAHLIRDVWESLPPVGKEKDLYIEQVEPGRVWVYSPMKSARYTNSNLARERRIEVRTTTFAWQTAEAFIFAFGCFVYLTTSTAAERGGWNKFKNQHSDLMPTPISRRPLNEKVNDIVAWSDCYRVQFTPYWLPWWLKPFYPKLEPEVRWAFEKVLWRD